MKAEAIHELIEQIQDLDTLLTAKNNLLGKSLEGLHYKIDNIEEKLDRVLAYIDKVESPQYQNALDNKEILINLLANAVITKLFAMFNNGQNQ